MRTRANSFLRVLFTMALFSLLAVGCGKENESGGGNNNNNGFWNGGGTTQFNNTGNLPGDWVARIENEYRCNTGINGNNVRQRVNVQVSGPLSMNANDLHVGVTLEGDILIIANQNNRTTVELRACRRPAPLTNNAQLYTQPVLNRSLNCSIGEVTAANIMLQSQYGPYELVFFPIGMSAPSSLCNNF